MGKNNSIANNNVNDVEYWRGLCLRVGRRLEDNIHPRYGPCDAIASGGCSECVKVVGEWKRVYSAIGGFLTTVLGYPFKKECQ